MMKKQTLRQLIRYQKIKAFYEKYERVLIPATLVLGVIVDAITFATINTTTTFFILAVHLVLAGGTVLFLHAFDARLLASEHRVLRYLRLSAPLIIQFTFGALLSGVFIFYFFSGTIFVSWPLIVLLVLLMISNDVFRHYYLKPLVQVGVYFFVLFSSLSIILPFTFNSLSTSLFFWSGAISLFFMAGYLALLAWLVPSFRTQTLRLAGVIIIIFSFVSTLYFFNIIPPIPLSIREAVVAHDLKRTASGYLLQVEPSSFFDRLLPGSTFHKAPGDRVYVYTAIFAPKNLNTKIIHHWQRYDEVNNTWVSHNRLSFALTGGRREGFRGYSVKSNVASGAWRVDVETERGQVLGRVRFWVEEAGSEVEVEEVER